MLLSPYGTWVDAYGLSSNDSGAWTTPVSAIVSNQEIAIVFPYAWNMTGDILVPSCTVTFSVIEGTVTL